MSCNSMSAAVIRFSAAINVLAPSGAGIETRSDASVSAARCSVGSNPPSAAATAGTSFMSRGTISQ